MRSSLSGLLARSCCGALAAALLLPAPADAAISVNRTRLIVTEQAREATPQVLNEGNRPVLIQAWVDTGQEQARVERIHAPFIVDPPMFRLEPGQSRSLRVLMVQPAQALQQDRESLFWFNVLEIPSKPEASGNFLQISFRTRLKVFYRPESVAKREPSESERLTFAIEREGLRPAVLSIRNPSPWHRTIDTLALVDPNGVETALDSVMIAPGQTLELPLKYRGAAGSAAAGWRVRFSTIDDFGVARDAEEDVAFD